MILSTHFRQPHRPTERELRMLDLYGRMVTTVISLVQIEQEKQVEQERQAVAEREQQLLSEQVQIAQAANASKDEFLTMLSHELRTPLTSITGWIQLMERGLLDAEQQQEAIATIRNSVWTQANLIEELLDVSRIVQRRFQITPQPCDLTQLLQQAVEQVQPDIEAKGLSLEVDFQPCPELLNLDPTRITQTISNLLSNAIKFTPSVGRIVLRLIDAPNQVQVQVSDTGQGITADLLPHTFERFRQADSSNTRRSGGLGLGLFLVQSFVEAHGGTIEANSPGAGQGATFTVTLPKAIAQAVQAAPAPATEVNLNGIRILLVEDDETVSTVISLMLTWFCATVTIAYSAAETLERLTQELPDLITSDIGLPSINGYDLIRQIRALPPEQCGQLPALALSGYADQQSVADTLKAGFQAHLSKPVKMAELISCVSTLVQR